MSRLNLAQAFAAFSVLDGLEYKHLSPSPDHRQFVVEGIWNSLDPDCSERFQLPMSRMARVRIFNMRGDATIIKTSLMGVRTLEWAQRLNWYADKLTAYHFKAFLWGCSFEDFSDLCSDIFNSAGRQQATLFGDKPKRNAPKGRGVGFRIGNRTSDFHTVGYMRRGELPAIEVRVSGAAAHRLMSRCLGMVSDNIELQRSLRVYAIATAAGECGKRLMSQFQSRGINLAEYAEALTYSYDPNHKPLGYWDCSTGMQHPVEIEDVDIPF